MLSILLLLLWLLLALLTSCTRHTDSSNYSFPNPRQGSSSMESINKEIDIYINQHSRRAVISDHNICSRKFVLGTYACPSMVGRGVHEFLNAIIGAVITNRTIVWQFCPRKPCQADDEETCAKYLERSQWMMSIVEAENAWKGSNCSKIFDRNTQLMDASRRHWSHKKLACCGIDRLDPVIITFGTFLDRHDMYYVAANSSRLLPPAASRARLLFSLGESVAYGLLFRSAFKFTQEVASMNTATLGDAYGATYYGIHLRHSTNNDDGSTYSGEIDCLKRVMASNPLQVDRRCVVLVASDRQQSVERVREQVRPLGCTAVISNHSISHKTYGEHGPFWGEVAMLDVELLSRSDFFIGSSYKNFGTLLSSYSMLVAALVATNKKGPALLQSSYFLPTCSSAVAGQYIHPNATAAHIDEIVHVRCSSSILLPEACPYFNRTAL